MMGDNSLSAQFVSLTSSQSLFFYLSGTLFTCTGDGKGQNWGEAGMTGMEIREEERRVGKERLLTVAFLLFAHVSHTMWSPEQAL